MRAALSSLLLLFAVPAAADVFTASTQGDFASGVDTSASQSGLVLGPSRASTSGVVWIPNGKTVLKVDAATGRQLAMYPASTMDAGSVLSIAVGPYGDAYVIGGTSTMLDMIILNCVVAGTSSDLNGDGVIDPDPAAGEYIGASDGCVQPMRPVASRGPVAVDRLGQIWFLTTSSHVVAIDPDQFLVVVDVPTPGTATLLVTGGDSIYVSDGTSVYALPITGTPLWRNVASLSGISSLYVDRLEHMLYAATSSGLQSLDLITATTGSIATGGNPNLVAAVPSLLWAAGTTSSGWFATGIDNGIHNVDLAEKVWGLSLDPSGNAWLVQAGTTVSPQVTRVDAATHAVTVLGGIGGPLVNGDFAGGHIAEIAPYAHMGHWTHRFDAGTAGMPWESIDWTATIPTAAQLTISIRIGDDPVALDGAAWQPAAKGPLSAHGRYLDVFVLLGGDGSISPTLSSILVATACAANDTCCISGVGCTTGSGSGSGSDAGSGSGSDPAGEPTMSPASGGGCSTGIAPGPWMILGSLFFTLRRRTRRAAAIS